MFNRYPTFPYRTGVSGTFIRLRSSAGHWAGGSSFVADETDATPVAMSDAGHPGRYLPADTADLAGLPNGDYGYSAHDPAGNNGGMLLIGDCDDWTWSNGVGLTTAAIVAAAVSGISAGGGGGGSRPEGDGDVPVDHNTGYENQYQVKSNGVPLGNAELKAFLKSDYVAGNRSLAYVKGYQVTKSDGTWVGPLMLSGGLVYTIVAYAPGKVAVTFDVDLSS